MSGWPKIEVSFDSVECGQLDGDFSPVHVVYLSGVQYNIPQPLPPAKEQLKQPHVLSWPDACRAMISASDHHKLTQFCGVKQDRSMLLVSFVLQNYAWDEFSGKPLRDVLHQTFPQRDGDNKIPLAQSPAVYVLHGSRYMRASVVLLRDTSRVVTRFDGTFDTLWICMLPGMVLQRQVMGGTTTVVVRNLVMNTDNYSLSYTDVGDGKFDRIVIMSVHQFNFLFVVKQ